VAEEKFRLPGSSYDELAKIIRAYGSLGGEASPAQVGSLTGKHETQVSRNNRFLLSMGIIEGGPGARRISQRGTNLALALEHGIEENVSASWRALCQENEFIQRVLSAVRVRQGMDRPTLNSHVAYTAGQSKTNTTMAGANALVDILLVAGLLAEENGRLVQAAPSAIASEEEESKETSVFRVIGEQSVQAGPSAIRFTSPGFGSATGTTTNLGYYWPQFGRVPFEVRLNLEVRCSPDELPALAPKIRQLIQDITNPPEDRPAET
jgi:hypothetical protein